ncbi:hypothetical protein [Chryseobacterium indicum]|uniref:hypothetical protein n=1 Tax=Chryseobacterium indicum TaxID=2766954 RepID=UPI001F2134EF|nr:hypothetical protein [Chryseobacterium sp. PS-8]
MQRKIISGKIKTPKEQEQKQKQLHKQLGEFVEWMKQDKNASEILKDQRKSVPINQLPMVF